MELKKTIINILVTLLVLDVPFLLYSYNFNKIVFDNNFYKKEFEKHEVYGRLEGYDIEEINNNVLSYLKNEDIYLADDGFFNERERIHLMDVKGQVQIILYILYFSIILFFVLIFLLVILNGNLKKIMKNVGIVFLFSGILTFLDSFVFWLIAKGNFDFVFELMHKIFFKAGTYVFDPYFERIVVLYPQQFFYDITVKIVLDTLVISLVLGLVGLVILLYKKIKTNKKIQ